MVGAILQYGCGLILPEDLSDIAVVVTKLKFRGLKSQWGDGSPQQCSERREKQRVPRLLNQPKREKWNELEL